MIFKWFKKRRCRKYIQILSRIGWSEDRRYDVSQIRQIFIKHGQALIPKAELFFEKYGNLIVSETEPYDERPKKLRNLVLDTTLVTLDELLSDTHNLKITRSEFDNRFCFVGQHHGNYLGPSDLLISEEGALFADCDGCLYYLGETIDEGICNLLTYGPAKRIKSPAHFHKFIKQQQ